MQSKLNSFVCVCVCVCTHWLTDSKVYVDRQKIQRSPHNIEGEEQSWRKATI